MSLTRAVRGRGSATLVVVLAVSACSPDDPSRSTERDAGALSCAPGERLVDDKGCVPAGVQDDGCAAGTLADEGGTCRPAGIAPEMCGAGFAPDGDAGCTAVLPARACAKGLIAVPGDVSCREVAPCATGTWGDIPVEANTQHVDAAFGGTGSDGSASKPWKTVHEAVGAAAPGAIVALAAGSYVEDVRISGKSVRLWGRCPKLVEIVGAGGQIASVSVEQGAPGTEVRDLALRGTKFALAVSGSEDVVVDRVWIHDGESRGLNVQDTLGPTSVELSRSLVERNREVGVFVQGSDATVDATAIRDVQPRALDQQAGLGISIQDAKAGKRATATVRGSLVDRSHELGVLVLGSDATIEATVVRSTQAQASDQNFGVGILVRADPASGERSNATVRASVVEGNRQAGVLVDGSDATVEATAIRDTQAQESDGKLGEGIILQGHPAAVRSTVTVRACVVERNHDAGVLVSALDTTIEATIVRDTQPQASDQRYGRGISFENDPIMGERGTATLRSCVIERNHELGVAVLGEEATIEATVVRDTQPQASDHNTGRGIVIQTVAGHDARAVVAIRTSVVERNADVGVLVSGSDAEIQATVVRDTQSRASDGLFGDGVGVDAADTLGASATIADCLVAGSVRAGVSSFAAAVSLSGTSLDCNAIQIDGENPYASGAFAFQDLGGDACGCAGEHAACKVLTSDLAPPAPLSEQHPD